MEFTEDNIIAVTGGNLVPKVNGKDLPMYQAVLVHKGEFHELCRYDKWKPRVHCSGRRAGYPGTDGQQIH